MKLELENYTPAEAEAISEVSQMTVRNWRRAGHLLRQEGHARYNLAQVAMLLVMGKLVSHGVTPDVAKGFAVEAARAIFQNAIFSPKAFSKAVKDQAVKDLGEPNLAEISRIKKELGSTFNSGVYEFMRCQEAMIDAAEQMTGTSGTKRPEWLVIWADGTLEFINSDENAHEVFFGNIQHDAAYVQGPVMMFCLGAFSQMLIDRIPRPAIRLAGEGA
jgi:hypothetical protein